MPRWSTRTMSRSRWSRSKAARDARVDLGDGLPGAAGQDEDRVGLRGRVLGGEDRHAQRDLPALRLGRVLRDVEGPAARRDAGRGDRVGELAGGEGDALAGGRCGGGASGEQQQGGQGSASVHGGLGGAPRAPWVPEGRWALGRAAVRSGLAQLRGEDGDERGVGGAGAEEGEQLARLVGPLVPPEEAGLLDELRRGHVARAASSPGR